MNNFVCVILAGGLGKRMHSKIPKVLHNILDAPMIYHVINTVNKLKPEKLIVVVGKYYNEIKNALTEFNNITYAYQEKAKGTADALIKAIPFIEEKNNTILVLNGDTPLISTETIKRFLKLHIKNKNSISVLTFISRNPSSYGRIKKDNKGNIISIVEESDANEEEKTINEVNSGIYAFEKRALRLLNHIKINKKKKEYYLTDIIELASKEGLNISAYCIGSEEELMGINTPKELDEANKYFKNKLINNLIKKGVSFIDKDSVYISSKVSISRETIIYPNVFIEGNTKIGTKCKIFPNVHIIDSYIGNGVEIKDSSVIEKSVIKDNVKIGPFAHLRPESIIGQNSKIGNFVEVKKSKIGKGTKAAHLTYIGDSKIGNHVNIGAGTITCNYDGYKKNITKISDDVFIGSDSQLIAPVKIGKGAYVGAGSTITKNVPPYSLALSRVKQINIKDWVLKRKKLHNNHKK